MIHQDTSKVIKPDTAYLFLQDGPNHEPQRFIADTLDEAIAATQAETGETREGFYKATVSIALFNEDGEHAGWDDKFTRFAE